MKSKNSIMITLVLVGMLSVASITSTIRYETNFDTDRAVIQAYTPFGPINILDDASFDSQASANGWDVNGNGQTLETAYVIQDLEIIDSIFPLIEIRSTSRYFIIQNCHLDGVDGGDDAILIFDCSNALLVEGNLIENIRHGVYLRNSHDVTIFNNTVDSASESALRIAGDNITIEENQLHNAYWNTIWLETTQNTVITHNNISGTHGNGIFFDGRGTEETIGPEGKLTPGDNTNNTVSYNSISGVETGILLHSSYYSTTFTHVNHNNITFCLDEGLDVWGSEDNYVEFNKIEFNGGYGVYVNGAANCEFNNNSISTNGQSGVLYHERPFNVNFKGNTIEWNFDRGIMFDDSNYDAVLYADIDSNTIRNNNESGIDIASPVQYLDITNNVIYGNFVSGITAYCSTNDAQNILISGNQISSNDGSGIELVSGLRGIDIIQNELAWNGGAGISIGFNVSDCDVIGNVIHDQPIGVLIGQSIGNEISLNTIYGCSNGIALLLSGSNSIFLNKLYDPSDVHHNDIGIYFQISHDSIVLNNTIIGCYTNGLRIQFQSDNNTIRFNSFIDNSGTTQATDDGPDNIIEMNYWNDWTTPDVNSDGFVDVPYNLTGSSNNSDPLPLADLPAPIESDYILNFDLLYPIGSELINATTIISWSEGIDTEGHPIYYTISYSSNGGSDWTEVTGGLTNTSYLWDTSLLPRGSNYRVMVNATCSENAEDVDSSAVFTLNVHSLQAPIVTHPNGGEDILGFTTIAWLPAVDSWEDSVTYSVFYSDNVGTDWIELVDDISATHYDWDSSSLEAGTQYMIRVIASCEYGLTSYDDSNAVFSLIGHTLGTLNILYPTTGVTVSGYLVITWNAVLDSWNHDVTYSVEYSDDDGSTWNEIARDLATTSLGMNISQLYTGSDYRIKVNAICDLGLTVEDITDTFSIIGQTPPPDGGAMTILIVLIGAGVAATIVIIIIVRQRVLGKAGAE